MSVFVALLAGGRGTRFWPASRAANPKQFLRLFGARSLLRLTFERFAARIPPERILVVTNPSYASRTREELPELPGPNLVLEPSGHDTAPAAALAARVAAERERDPIVIVAPTDHFVQDRGAFQTALDAGIEAAAAGSLVTFGVVPDRPATTYGYIEVADPAGRTGKPSAVVRFREKPGPEDAAAYLATGRFFWNAGLFVWRTEVFWQELRAVNAPLEALLSALPSPSAPDFAQRWEALPSISIDYALMEKARRVIVVPLAAGWSDVGGWDAVRELQAADADGNRPSEGVLYLGARDCSVHRHGSSSRRLYALVGTDGLIVVETDDAVLVCRKGAGETLREVVKRLEGAGRKDLV